jgi:hypothetical protein
MIDDLTDLGAVLEDFASPYTVTRPGALDFDTTPGQAAEGSPSTLNITGVLQPVSGRDLQRLPEGFRTDTALVLYTETALQVLPAPDLVAAQGATWQAETVETWGTGGFYKVILRKVG